MQNAALTQHLILLEERQAEMEAHLSAIEPCLRRIESSLPIPSALSLVAQRLGAIDAKLARLVPPADVRASMLEATEHQAAVADAAPLQAQQLADISAWIDNRMTGDQMAIEFDDLAFVSKQLIGILQGSRDDLVLMRNDIRRLAALCEQVLRARVDDDERGMWRPGDQERRATDRRRASGF